jgi:hypothetical protein
VLELLILVAALVLPVGLLAIAESGLLKPQVVRFPATNRINVSEDNDVRYWSEKFGVTVEQLLEAVQKVGNSAGAVEAELKLKHAAC